MLCIEPCPPPEGDALLQKRVGQHGGSRFFQPPPVPTKSHWTSSGFGEAPASALESDQRGTAVPPPCARVLLQSPVRGVQEKGSMESGDVPGAPRTHHVPSCPRGSHPSREIPTRGWSDSTPAPLLSTCHLVASPRRRGKGPTKQFHFQTFQQKNKMVSECGRKASFSASTSERGPARAAPSRWEAPLEAPGHVAQPPLFGVR